MGRQPNRITPKMPAHLAKTYQIVAPRSTHTRPATCAEIDCQASLKGWATTVQEGSADEAAILQAAAGQIDGHRRSWRRLAEAGGFVRYVFASGQACFAASKHRISLEREPLHVVRDGDWRGNPSGRRRQHVRGADWVDDFATHQQNIADRIGRG
jgi:hypothetical protein